MRKIIFLAFLFLTIPFLAQAEESITFNPTSTITGTESSVLATTSDGGSGGNGNGYRAACIFNPDGTSYTASNCGTATASRNADIEWNTAGNSVDLPISLPVDTGYLVMFSDDDATGMAGNCSNQSFTYCRTIGYGYVATGTIDILEQEIVYGTGTPPMILSRSTSPLAIIFLGLIIIIITLWTLRH